MDLYELEFSRNPKTMWSNLKTADPTDREKYTSLFEWSKSMSNYHFTDASDLNSLDSDLPSVIPITNFNISDIPDIDRTKPATFARRSKNRKSRNNEMEEADFRRWGYDIDGGYAIVNRRTRPELPSTLQSIVDKFGMKNLNIKFDVQKPGQCFYWHLDAFGGHLSRQKDQEFSRGNFEKHSDADFDQRKMMRIVIFLDDQKVGQHWQHGNLIIKWKKGDCISWPWKDVPHGTANYGHDLRPTLNVTGEVTEKTYDFLNNVNR
jgi:hypothetical protein